MNEVIYDSNKVNKDPYISLLDYFTVEKQPSMRLKPADFVYLTDLGVYPINRLIILRRFRDGVIVPNNLTLFKEKPISTVIGWIKAEDNKDLFSLNFNERWMETSETLDKVIQKIMKEQFNIKTETFMPIPAWSQGFLFGMLHEMKLTADYDSKNVPTGDPNVLRKGTMRDVESQSLLSELKITFETSYEQKYISDVDPGLAFQDIISNLVRMGTSDQKFVINPNSVDFRSFVAAVNSEAQGSTDQWITFGKYIVKAFMSAVSNFFKGVGKAGKEYAETFDKLKDENYILQQNKSEEQKNGVKTIIGPNVLEVSEIVNNSLKILKSFGDTLLAGSVYRYRWPLKGSMGVMSGLNTTPWHLTVGNPFSPILNIGNIVVSSVDLKFSNEMGFNDMPKRVNVNIDIKFGRDLGKQEIEKMFNNQYGRIYSNPNDKTPVDYTDAPQGYHYDDGILVGDTIKADNGIIAVKK
jgi:hypothetical protein